MIMLIADRLYLTKIHIPESPSFNIPNAVPNAIFTQIFDAYIDHIIRLRTH